MSFVKIELVGFVGAKPELKTNSNGKKYTRLVVYVNKKTQNKQETQVYSCMVYNEQAALVVRYCEKGNVVYIDGEPSFSHYIDKNDQSIHVSINVFVNKIHFIGSSNNNKNNHQQNESDDFNIEHILENSEEGF